MFITGVLFGNRSSISNMPYLSVRLSGVLDKRLVRESENDVANGLLLITLPILLLIVIVGTIYKGEGTFMWSFGTFI